METIVSGGKTYYRDDLGIAKRPTPTKPGWDFGENIIFEGDHAYYPAEEKGIPPTWIAAGVILAVLLLRARKQ